MILELGLYLLLGALVGILAGLLGVGGGLIIVPVLAGLFTVMSMPGDIIMHLALGTSLATILATSIASVYSHHRKGAVSWSQAFRLTPGILLGAWCGGWLASIISSDNLKPLFALFELAVAAHMIWGSKPDAHKSQPGALACFSGGGVIGTLSSLLGIGGGTLTVPWLMWYGSSIHRAIATAAAVGFPIALAGTLSYLIAGWQHVLLPDYALGFIYLPALLGIIISSTLFAPLGAHWAHQLNTTRLKHVFAGLLVVLAVALLLA